MSDESLRPESVIGGLLKARGWTITAAESCTGGLIMTRLTDISGSSAYITGGIVTYANETKMKFLNVSEQTLINYGAVSEQCAAEMARGARLLFGADMGLSATGIAGPGGATDSKPVGLVYIGLSVPDQPEMVERYVWDGDRITNRELSAAAAIRLAIRWLESNPAPTVQQIRD